MPSEGMYTQRDPIGLAGGNPTTYGYVFNTLQEVDPWGLKRCKKWDKAKRDFWKNEAKNNPHKYSAANLKRMSKKGSPPRMKVEILKNNEKVLDTTTVSMELHHNYLPQRSGSKIAHQSWNLEIVTPWGHASVDPYRNTGYELVRIINGVNSWK